MDIEKLKNNESTLMKNHIYNLFLLSLYKNILQSSLINKHPSIANFLSNEL
jgi:hypothetical protein